MSSPVLTVDVAHPPRHPDLVEQELLDAWQKVRNSSDLGILKIIHGYGRSGKGGSTRAFVRDWAFRHRHRFLAVIPGEEFALTHDATAQLRKEAGNFPDADLGNSNAGMTIVWVKKNP
jgi:hypothetical protein